MTVVAWSAAPASVVVMIRAVWRHEFAAETMVTRRLKRKTIDKGGWRPNILNEGLE
jgi:hypothetical protein